MYILLIIENTTGVPFLKNEWTVITELLNYNRQITNTRRNPHVKVNLSV
jgi:hypothetical protein